MTYSLGNVKPWVARAANVMGPMFGIRTIYGYSYRTIDGGGVLSDHALGLALDFMCDIPTGNALAAYAQAHARELSVTYIIHNRRIWNIARASEGWRPYTGRNPHTDHVHVSFSTRTGSGTPSNPTASDAAHIPTPPIPHVPNPLDLLPGDPTKPLREGAGAAKDTYEALVSVAKFAALLANPHTWVRVLMFGAGLWSLIIGVSMLIQNQSAADAMKATAQTATRAVARTGKVATNAR